MNAFALGSALAVLFHVSMPAVAVAQGSGGGQSGGHGGGHAASGSGGRASGGHAGGQSQGSTAAGDTVARGAGTSAATSASQPTAGHPRDDRPLLGTAVPRTGTTPSSPGLLSSYSLNRFWPLYDSAFGFGGLGLYSSYDPFCSSFTYGYPGCAYPYAPAPAWSVSGYSAPYGYIPDPFDAERITGGLRLKVEPKEAQVYVDGYYAGVVYDFVDDFNGHFQRLKLIPGPHHVEVRAPGYQSLEFDITIEAFRTTEYKGALQR